MNRTEGRDAVAVLLAALVAAFAGWEVAGALTWYGTAPSSVAFAAGRVAETLLAHPIGPWKGSWPLLGAMAGFASVAGFWSWQQFFVGNFDPGRERGDARRALPQEFDKLRDGRCTTNNMTFTRSAQLALSPPDARTARALYAKNLNSIWVGTSGTGKSRNGTKPMIMNAAGSALADRVRWPHGWREDADDEGFDLVVTDPKGDTLRETGWFLHFAGMDVKVFNCIDFSAGLHFNPLWYIKVFETDAVADVGASVGWRAGLAIDGNDEGSLSPKAATADGKPVIGDGTATETAHVPAEDTASGVAHTLSVAAEVVSESVAAADYAHGRRSMYATMGASGRDDAEHAQALDTVVGGRRRAGGSPSEAALSIVYKRSEVRFTVRFENNSPDRHDVRIELELDDLLEDPVVDARRLPVEPDLISGEQQTRVSVWTQEKAMEDGGRTRIVVMEVLFANRAAGPNGEVYEFEVSCPVKSRRVADGVDLTCMIDALVSNLNIPQDGDAPGADPFWDDTEKLLFMSIAAYLIEAFGREHCNFPTLIDYLLMAKVSFDGTERSPLDCVFDAWERGEQWVETGGAVTTTDEYGRVKTTGAAGYYEPSPEGPHPASMSLAVHCYRAFKQGAPETLQSIIISCQRSLTRIATEELRELLRYDELELETLGDAGQRQAIFGIVSDTDPTYRFLFGIMNYITVNITCNKARERYGGKLPRHVHFIFDEFANIGKLPAFEAAISVVRSRNMSISLFLQTVSQLEDTYGDKRATTIRGNCTTMVFLGGSEQDNLDQISAAAGKETLDEMTWSRSYGLQSGSTVSRQKVERDVVTASQLQTTPPDKAWVLMLGMNVLCDDKFPLEEHPYYAFIDPGPKHPDCIAPGPFEWRDYIAVRRGAANVAMRETRLLKGGVAR